jgi:hypothetical protein
MDAATTTALVTHLQATNTPADGMTSEKSCVRCLPLPGSRKGWATGSADGQSLVVEPAEVRQAQDAEAQLCAGAVGRRRARLSAIEIFQEDSGMNVTGLLTATRFKMSSGR